MADVFFNINQILHIETMGNSPLTQYCSSGSLVVKIHRAQLRPSLLLCMLLLVLAGVEQNPGPEHICKDCGNQFQTSRSYFNHQKNEHLSVPCSFINCQYSTSSLNAFQIHLTRCHSKEDTSSSFVCPLVSCALPLQEATLKMHLEVHLKLGQTFTCPYSESCKLLVSKVSSFRTHLSRSHQPQEKLQNVENIPQPPSTSSRAAVEDSIPGYLPPNVVKEEIIKFYLELEGGKVLPSLTVQLISENISRFMEMSHKSLQKTMTTEMIAEGVDQISINRILLKTFQSDPVYNIHHKSMDADQVSSMYFRKQILKKRLPYVQSIEIQLPGQERGKPKVAQYVPIRDMLEVVFQDSNVKKEVLKSFQTSGNCDELNILVDFKDGTAYKDHKVQHNNHDCINLIFFQDAFEYNPFGPAKGLYKTIGMYYIVGNLSPEYRSKVDLILLALLIQERYLKPNEQELLDGVNKFEEAMNQLIIDLKDLKTNGILIDGVVYPVCVLFFTGDNLGSHQIGSFIQCFTAEFCCRYCPMSMLAFKAEPHKCKRPRTPEEYDECVLMAKIKFDELKKTAIETQNKKRERQMQKVAAGEFVAKRVSETKVSRNNLRKLQSVSHLGVKPVASALNELPGFHVSNNGLPPCLAHDLFEGVVDQVLAKILEHFILSKEWFDLAVLNKRITQFRYKEQDARDAPNALRSFDGVKGHACETWTLLRLLPFIIGDLIQDPQDEYWLLYLQLKEICKYICAPRISRDQVTYLQTLIQSYLCNVKTLLSKCLTPKHHFLMHYPSLIIAFGPLIRLFTLRFESKHVFFKLVAKICKSYRNIVFTLAQKYQFRFAHDHIKGLLLPDITYIEAPKDLKLEDLPYEVMTLLPESISPVRTVYEVVFKGTHYRNNLWLVLDKLDLVDLSVGQIHKILISHEEKLIFILRMFKATNSFNGYYIVATEMGPHVADVSSLSDHYPLPSYNVGPNLCISLKHSLVFM